MMPAPGASVNYTYTYDVGQAALGQLTGVRASDGSYSKNLLYDADGRVRAEGMAIFGSINYTTSYTYDAYQRLVVTTYPGGEKVRVGYNSMGLPETLTSTAVISPLVSSVDYDAAGRPVTLQLAGGWLHQRAPALLWLRAPAQRRQWWHLELRDYRQSLCH